ncbi:MAG: hypothetical protein HC889_12655 [Synechococcaceae cyanobacterium SM1_2_3]|nr:hypothetical protein [Synechococcaceae cyanobacterium SM1_2_3]
MPQDGASKDKVFRVSYETALQEAGFPVIVIPNQGAGAAKMRIEAARRLFPVMWFNEETTAGGREALGWYHEKRRADGYGLGPEHDWSSHDGDAFGLMAIAHSMHQPMHPGQFSARGSTHGQHDWLLERRADRATASWSEADMVPLLEWRKQAARDIQRADLGKECRREAKKREKAATILINFLNGDVPSPLPRDYWPVELGWQLKVAGIQLGRSGAA